MRRLQARAAVSGPRDTQPRAAVGQCSCGAPIPPNIFTPPPVAMPPMAGNSVDVNAYMAWLRARGGNANPQGDCCIPYVDALRDRLLMSVIASGTAAAPYTSIGAGTPAAPGAVVPFTVNSTRGWFDVWYIAVRSRLTADGTPNTTFIVTPPTLQDCPAPTSVIPSDGLNWSTDPIGAGDGCCMGVPFRAIIGASVNGESTPLTINVQSIGAASSAQVSVWGFPHRNNVCISP
jgi:hypothetical protein